MFHRLSAPILRAGRTKISSFSPVSKTTINVRNFSAVPPVDPTTSFVTSAPEVTSIPTDAVSVAAEVPDKINMFSDAMMQFVDHVHLSAGVPYWEAIALTTLATRFVLLPLTIATVKNAAKLGLMRPEMQRIQDAMRDDPDKGNPATVGKYQAEMKAIYNKHGANPFKALLMPLVQLPLFIGFFIALREMGNYYPDYSTGGVFWFTDLGISDPYYILPVFNALSFLVMIEIGSDGMANAQAGQFKMIMRGLALFMVPATAGMPAGLFCYWGVNNMFSIIQTFVLKQEPIRKFFGIPKPVAGDVAPPMKMANFSGKIKEAILNERSKGLDAPAEMLDNHAAPKKETPATASAAVADVATPATFTTKAKKGAKK